MNLNFAYYNYARAHQSLRVKNAGGTFTKRIPAMATGLFNYVWSMGDIAELLDHVQ